MQAYLDRLNVLIGQKNTELLATYGAEFFNRWDMVDVGDCIFLTTDVLTPESGYLSLIIEYDVATISALSSGDQEEKAAADFAAAAATLP